MKYRIGLAAAALLLAASTGFAQTTAPDAASAPAAPAESAPTTGTPPAPETTKDGKPTMKSVREQCRTEVLASGVKGDARRQAMADCIIKQRPDMEARIKCAMDPSLKGMAKDARRAAVKTCVQQTKP